MPAALRSACARLRAAVDRSLVSAVRGLHAWRAVAVPTAWGPRVEPLEGRVLFNSPTTGAYEDPSGLAPFSQRSYCQCPPLLLQESSASQNNEGPEMGLDSSLAPIRYSDGQPEISATDIASGAVGGAFDQARSFSMSVTSGPLGNHWTAFDMPFLVDVPYDPGRPGGASDTIAVVESGVDQIWFDDFSGTWVQRDSGQDTLTLNGTTHLFTLADTTGQTLQFDDFSPTSTSNDVAGQFSGMTDAAGNVTTVTGTSMTYDGDITQIRRTGAVGSEVESWDFSYATVGGTPVISTVDLSRSTDGGSTFTSVQEADYAYYTDNSEAGGSTGDLASVQVYDSFNLSDPISVTDYRYWKSAESVDSMTQPLGDLKAIFNTEDVARASAAGFDPATSSDADLAPYVNNFYAYYDSSHTPFGFPDPPVYQETAAGFGGTSTGGLGTFTYTYTDSGLTAGYNTWSQKTVEDLPGGGSNTIYTNYEGGVILNAHVASGDEWDTGYEYNAGGAQIIAAQPSAVTTTYVSGEPTLLTDGSTTWYLNSTGLENVTTYASTTTATSTSAGDVAGYVSGTALRQGYATGSDVPQSGQMYIAHTDANGNTVYQIASSTVYRNSDGTGAETTAYSFQWFAGTNAIESETTTLPTITTGENGSNSAIATTVDYDRLGNALYTIDGDGYVQADQYDPGTGAITQDVQDAPPYAATLLADGPLAYYRLDEASGTVAADSSGNGNTGAYSGGVTLGASGALDNDADTSVALNGSTGQVTVPDSSQFSLTGAISMEAWFKTTDTGANYILSKGTSAGSLALNPAGLSAGQVGVYLTGVNDSSGHGWLYSPSSGYNDGQWHQAAATYDGATLRLYIDGSQVATLAYSGTLATNADDVSIGSNAGSSDFFNGSLDEVAVYGSALSADRVLAHYDAATITRTPLALTTTSQIDVLGRTVEQTSPAGNKTYTLFTDGYNSSTGVIGESQTYTGWNATTGATTGPIEVSLEYLPSSSGEIVYSETLTSSATPAVSGSPGSYVPTGAETLDASNIQSLSRVLTGDGNQTTEQDDYSSLSGASYSLSSSQLGTAGTNFNATIFGYSGFMGGQNHVVDPTGTITDTVMDGRGRPVATYVGTDDSGATDSDPTNGGAGGNNMTETASAEYDNNGIGDGNLTDVTVYPGGGAAARSTLDFYNWRDELVAEKDGASSSESDPAGRPIYYYTLDNLGEVIQTQQFDGDGVSVTTTAGVPVAPSSSLRVAESTASYDELGDVYQTTVFPVTAGTGSVGTYGLSTEYYRDSRGDMIETINPGGQVDKSAFDGAGRDIIDSVTDGGAAGNGGTPLLGYADAGSTVGDVVVSQTQHVYDPDGDEIETISSDMGPSPASTSTVPGAGFEYPDTSGGYIFGPSTDSSNPWAFGINSGVTGNANAFTGGNPDAPEAAQVAFLQAAGSDASQSITFATGTYTLTFSAAQRENFNHGGQDFQVLVDGNVIDTVTPGSIDYQDYTTASFTVTAGSHTIEFKGLDTVGGDNTAFIDYVRLNAVPFRTSYTADYFDAADRPTAEEDVGTNGGTAWTRPSSPDASDATHLVTTETYNSQGLEATSTDPRGIVNATYYNLLGQTTETIAAYTDGTPTAGTNQTTDFTYNGDGEETSQTAVMPSGTPDQTTDWVFGVTTGAGSTIDSNNLLAKEEFPDPTTGDASTSAANDVSYTVDSLGENLTMTDQNGSTHTYAMDTLGRETGDTVTTLGSGVDGSALMLGYAYAALGLPYTSTAYSDTVGGTVVNQVLDQYNGLGQITAEYQSHSGAVATSGPTPTPSVQYSYNLMAGGANNSNLRSVSYPDGRILDYDYGQGQEPVTGIAVSGSTATVTTAVPEGLSTGDSVLIGGSSQAALNGTFTITVTSSTTFTYTFSGSASSDTASLGLTETPVGLDALIGRPDGLQDQAGSAAGTVLQGYQYLGLGAVVQQADGNGVELTYIQQSGDGSAITSGDQYAGDQYTGLDRFGRVIDQNWLHTDRFQLNYDQDSNVIYSDNLVTSGNSQLYHASSTTTGDDATAYDPLGRLTDFEQGTLSASGNNGSTLDTVSSPTLTKDYSLDAVGNQTAVSTDGTPVDNASNSQNELTADGSSTLTYDNDGNTTTDQSGNLYSLDAWNHVITALGATTNYQTTYSYDALGERVTTQPGARTDFGPVLVVNNGSPQRSMVDSLTVIFPSAVTLSAGAITLYNTTGSYTESTTYSNPSSDGKTWLISFTGGDITGGSLPNAIYNLTVTAADVSGITLSSDVTWAFHRLFGDINGNGTIDSADTAILTEIIDTLGYDPALDHDANGNVNIFDKIVFRNDTGTTYTYTPTGSPFLTLPVSGSTTFNECSAWAPATNDLYYSTQGQVLETRVNGTVTTQNVWGLDYVNDLVATDTSVTAGSLGISGSGLGQRLYAQHDANFDVTALTDSTGAVVERYTYDPYGNVTVLNPDGTIRGDGTLASSHFGVPNLFQGMRYDSVTGLYASQTRDLNPATGTWIEADPAGYGDGASRYQSFDSNPAGVVDPNGLFGFSNFLGIVKAIGGAAQVVGGVAFAVATSESGVGIIAGAAVALHGIDDLQAGVRQAISGQNTPSVTSQTAAAVATDLGANRRQAGVIGEETDAAITAAGALVTGGVSGPCAGLQAVTAGGETVVVLGGSVSLVANGAGQISAATSSLQALAALMWGGGPSDTPCPTSSPGGTPAKRAFKKTKPGLTGKEGAKDVPSWAKGSRPYTDENGRDFATRLLDAQYGKGNWSGKGSTSEFSQIKKWGDRAFE